jgi:hypothetical protein
MGLSQVGANDSIFACSLGFMVGISMATMVYKPTFNLGVDQSTPSGHLREAAPNGRLLNQAVRQPGAEADKAEVHGRRPAKKIGGFIRI